MNRTKLLLMLLALFMCVGAVAADVTETLPLSSKKFTDGGNLTSLTLGDNTSKSGGSIKISSGKNGSFTIAVKDASKYYLKSIVFTTSNTSWSSFTATTGSVVSKTKTWTAADNTKPTTVTFTIAASSQVNVSGAKITLGEQSGDTPTPTPSKTDVTLSFPEKSYTVTEGETFTAPVLTVEPEAAASEVKYTSSKTNVATVDASTGAVTVKGVGSATITAAISGSDTYNDASASYTLTVNEVVKEQAETPTISGTTPFDDNTKVTITAESGATIYYTTDGTTPTTKSTKYSSALTISETTTVKAIAVVDGKDNSDVASKTFTKNEKQPDEPTQPDEPSAEGSETISDFSVTNNIVEFKSTQTPSLVTISGSDIQEEADGTHDGYLKVVKKSGTFTITSSSTLKSVVVNFAPTDKWHPDDSKGFTETTGSGTLTLPNPYTVATWTDSKSAKNIKTLTFKTATSGHGLYIHDIVITYWQANTVLPKVSPASSVHHGSVEVTVTPAKDDAYVVYTTDGSTPTATNGTKITKTTTFTLTGKKNFTVTATGFNSSDKALDNATATATYTFEQIIPATPTFSPAAGKVNSGTVVTVKTATEGATIYYTMGSNPKDPTTESDVFPANGVAITEATTIKAIAVYDDVASAVASASYTLKSAEDMQLSEYDENRPIGWGEKATGSGYWGQSGQTPVNPIVVTTYDQLVSALQGTDPRTIYVRGELIVNGADTIRSAKNKTVIGEPGSKLVSAVSLPGDQTRCKQNINITGILCFAYCDNIILRNLYFEGPGAYDCSGKDNLTFHGSTNMWVDHCVFEDGIDGNFDIIHGSDNVSVTWCKFRYTSKSKNHQFCDLVGHDDWNYVEDLGHLNCTFAYNWWADGVKDRMPRMRYGKFHIFNNYYTAGGTYLGVGYHSASFAEYNYFGGGTLVNTKNTGRKTYNDGNPYGDGSAQYSYRFSNNNKQPDNPEGKAGSIDYYTPSYTYTPITDVTKIPAIISDKETGAGQTLDFMAPATAATYIQPSVKIASGRQYATYASAWNTDWSGVNGAKAYIIKTYESAGEGNTQNLILQQIDYVPGGTGIVIYGVPGTYEPDVTTEAGDITGNMLVGTVSYQWIGVTGDIISEDTDINPDTDMKNKKYKDRDENPSNGIQRTDGAVKDDNYYDYILKSGRFVFSAPGRIAPNKAYLHLPKKLRDSAGTSDAKGFAMVFDNTTGIDTLQDGVLSHEEKVDNSWYTISGARLNGKPAQRGVYIHNGKKVVIK